MKRGKTSMRNPEGRCYTTSCSFQLSARERIRALLGGKVFVQTRIFVSPGASSIPNEIIKRVDARESWWPWRKAS
jgi:hypothetical protein